MDATTVGAVVLPLVGVALGTAGTLTGQYLATRGDARRHLAAEAAAARTERKQAIVDFLDAAQRLEQRLDDRVHGRPQPDADVGDLLHALWLAKKVLELVCGYELATVAHRYTALLHSLSRAAQSTGRSAEHVAYRAEFIEAARRELGVAGPRLYPVTMAE